MNEFIKELQEHPIQGFWYLMHPYSNLHPSSQDRVMRVVARIHGTLAAHDVAAYSPIHHTLSCSLVNELRTDAAYWQLFNEHFMRAAVGGILIPWPGWQLSKGVSAELLFFSSICKPVKHMNIGDVL